jgi:transcriptional regulator with XRE-family HTH domain
MQTVTNYPTIVGKIIAQIRDQRGLRQEDLAQAMGVTQTTLSRIETGQSSISVEHLRLASHHLGVRPNQILADADNNETILQSRGMTIMFGRDNQDLPPAAIFLGGAALAALLTLAVVGSQQG